MAVVGPTAAGKTAAGIAIALRHGGEVVNADSRLLYRGLQIGAASPTEKERRGVPHHLIHLIEPYESYSVAAFLDSAGRTIDEILARGNLPTLVGGSGQYVWALLEGWSVPKTLPDPELRRKLEESLRKEGLSSLVQRLKRIDPEVAAEIDLKNPRRVTRALERAMTGAGGVAGRRARSDPPYDALIIGLTTGREELYRRIDRRLDDMIHRGWACEVKRLLDAGIPLDAPAMSAIGYRDVARYAAGEMSLVEAKTQVKRATRILVRRQYNWFKLSDDRIRWIEAGPNAGEEAAKLTGEWLQTREFDPNTTTKQAI